MLCQDDNSDDTIARRVDGGTQCGAKHVQAYVFSDERKKYENHCALRIKARSGPMCLFPAPHREVANGEQVLAVL